MLEADEVGEVRRGYWVLVSGRAFRLGRDVVGSFLILPLVTRSHWLYALLMF